MSEMATGFKRKETLTGPGGLRVDLDATEIFPDDPGNGTPAIVRLFRGRREYTATYWCACGEGELEGNGEFHWLTPDQMKWLDSLEDAIDNWLTAITRAIEAGDRKEVLAALDD